MNYLKTFRTEAESRLVGYRDAEDELTALKALLNWLSDKQLESYRNGQASGKGKDTTKE